MDDVDGSVYNVNASISLGTRPSHAEEGLVPRLRINLLISVSVFESASNSLLLPPTCRELPYYRQVDGSVHQHVSLMSVPCCFF